jgi:uncharacterized protein (TIGR02145 family)
LYTIGETGTVTDIDGNVYHTVVIGTQEWMVENLKVTHYRNGDAIPNVTKASLWENPPLGSYCDYDNNSDNSAIYGHLYNWYAITDYRNITPVGWHPPTDEEWRTLLRYLGMSQAEVENSGWNGTDEGGKLKEAGYSHWQSPNLGATNESGFTALPGGYRGSPGVFVGLGNSTHFWTTTSFTSYYAYTRYLGNGNSNIGYTPYEKCYGFSVRLVRD